MRTWTWLKGVWTSLVAKMVKESACNVGDQSLIPGLGRSSGEENGYPLQYSCLENSKDRGAWQATVHVFAESYMTERLISTPNYLTQTQLSCLNPTVELVIKSRSI